MIMDTLKRLFRYFNIVCQDEKLPFKRPSQDSCALLQLPIDVLLSITDHLPRHGLYTLTRTCSQMGVLLDHHHHLSYEHLRQDRTECLEYLTCISRNMLDRWVCSQRVKLCAVDYNDYPESLPWPADHSRVDPENGEVPFNISARHPQLALKYIRLADHLDHDGWEYLGRLVAAQHGILYGDMHPGSDGARLFWQAEVRIVGGRYLKMVEISAYYPASDGCSELDPFKWSFCKHQKAVRHAWLAANPRVQSLIDTPVTDDELPEIKASCPYCPTDIAFVRRERWSCVVRIWVDYGPEASPIQPCWESLVAGEDTGFRNVFGKVRRLYESAGSA
jgi:hypothetical protein